MYTYSEAYEASLKYFDGDELAAKVFVDKYALRDNNDSFHELTPTDMHRRLAKEFSRIESKKFKNPMSEDEIFDLLDKFKYIIPQGSPMYGIGNPYQIVSYGNCFVIPSPYDSYGGIVYTDAQITQISCRRGGVGWDISSLRPAGLPVKNAAKTTSGSIEFMKRFSNTIREVGQCIAKGERVLLKSGLTNIEDVNIGDQIWTHKGWKSVINKFENGQKNIYKVTTKKGFSIRCSEEHKFYNENLELIPVKDFEVGENICLLTGTCIAKDLIKLDSKINYELKGTSKSSRLNTNVQLPEYLNKNIAYLLGYSYGDGFFNIDKFGEKDYLQLACSNDYPEIKTKLINIIKSEFGYNPNIKNGDGNLEIISIYSKIICKFLDHNNIAKEKSRNIQFPSKIFNSSSDIQLAFISGYLDADGCASNTIKSGINFNSINKDFLTDCQFVLMSNGINTSLRDNTCKNRLDHWNNIYRLSINGGYSQRLSLELLKESIKVSKIEKISVKDFTRTAYTCKNLNISRGKLSYLGDGFISCNVLELLKQDKIIDTNIQPLILDEIIFIEPDGTEDTYDLTVEDTHMFWCEGFYTKNSGRRGASLQSISVKHPDILEFIKIKQNLTEVTGSNISVKFTDGFMKAVENNENYNLCWPIDGDPKISKTINAHELWNEFVYSAWLMAEPGCMFEDRVLEESTSAPYGYKEVSSNPCFTGDTLIAVADGRNAVSIKQLAEEDKDIPVYSINKDGLVEIKIGRHPRLTGKQVQIIRVHLDDNTYLDVTPNHKFLLKNGTMKEAKDLVKGDSLPRFTKKREKIDKNGKDYGYTNQDIEDFAMELTKQYGRRLSSKEWIIEATKANMPKTFTTFRHEWFKTPKELLIYCANKLKFNNNECDPRLIKTLNKMLKNGYEAKIVNGAVLVNKKCEQCNCEFETSHQFREQSFCCHSCSMKYINTNFRHTNIINSLKSKEIKQQNIKEKQAKIYSDLKAKLGRDPLMKEWEIECKQNKIPYRVGKKLRFAFKNFKDVEEAGNNYNHKVCKIEYLDELQDVYNITVDDNHTVGIITSIQNNNYNGIYTYQCGEQFLPPYASCRLLVVNLYSYINNKFTDKSSFNWDLFKQHVKILQRLGDDLVDLEIEAIDKILAKIQSDPEPDFIKQIAVDLWSNIRETALQDRRTGCGFTGLADALAALDIKYASQECIDFVEELQKQYKFSAYESSVDMAEELGSFPMYDSKLDIKSKFIQRIKDENPSLYKRMTKYGRRNMTLLTIAPTGSVSCLTQTSSGLEPVFCLSYTRRKKGNPNDKDFRTDFIDQNGDCWMHFEVFHKGFKDWMNISGSSKVEESPYFMSTANEIDWINRVKLQSVLGKHIDNSISSTINLPNDVSKEKVSEIYMTAWKEGLKGITVYRDGCRTGVLVTDTNTNSIKYNEAPKRPTELHCDVHKITVKGQPYFVLVGLLDEKPYEVFAGADGFIDEKVISGKILKKKKPKGYKAILDDGTEISPLHTMCNDDEEALMRMTSTALRHGADIVFITEQLQKTKGEMTSFAKAVSRALKKYIKDGTTSKELCPECQNSLIYKEGCKSCQSCGWSKCQ